MTHTDHIQQTSLQVSHQLLSFSLCNEKSDQKKMSLFSSKNYTSEVSTGNGTSWCYETCFMERCLSATDQVILTVSLPGFHPAGHTVKKITKLQSALLHYLNNSFQLCSPVTSLGTPVHFNVIQSKWILLHS